MPDGAEPGHRPVRRAARGVRQDGGGRRASTACPPATTHSSTSCAISSAIARTPPTRRARSCARWPRRCRRATATPAITPTPSTTLVAGRRRRGSASTAAALAELSAVALLHDVGKIGIPDALLHKPGPLDDDEWRADAPAPVIGERILSAVPGLEQVARAVRHEHERWDGHGYPDGLAGDEIPLASRIVLACDAWHALVSDRPYRTALDHEAALGRAAPLRRHAVRPHASSTRCSSRSPRRAARRSSDRRRPRRAARAARSRTASTASSSP